jgi:hypothetical protein
LSTTFPARIGNGARRRARWDVEVVQTDSGHEVRNSRWDEPLWTFEVPMPTYAADDDADFAAIRQLYIDAMGSTNTFNFVDDLGGVTRKVRFDDDLQIEDISGPYRSTSLVLQEVRD